MDLVLSVADQLVLDTVYAKLVPLTAFVDAPSIPTSSPQAVLSTSPSAWAGLVRSLPHPPLSPEVVSSALNSTVSSISAWPRDYFPRQVISVSVLTIIGIHALYFIFAGLSYYFIFNHEMMKHPKFLKNQVRLEIQSSLRAFPGMTLLTLPIFLAEVRGYSKLYDNIEDCGGWTYLILSVPLYLVFTDYFIYWIHRLLHHPLIYKYIHKPHHKWLIPTPFASHAFHFVDGYLQSVPYHAFIFIFPLQRVLHLVLFVAVNFWSIFIHDSEMITGSMWETIINGPSHHTLHHLYFTCNYGQYFTWADRACGSYKQPRPELDPFLEVMADKNKKAGKAE